MMTSRQKWPFLTLPVTLGNVFLDPPTPQALRNYLFMKWAVGVSKDNSKTVRCASSTHLLFLNYLFILQDNVIFLLFPLFIRQNYINSTITLAPDSSNLDVNQN